MLKRLIAVVRLAEGKAFAISFGPTFVALVFQLGAFVLLGRALGAAQFGQISAAMALAVVLVEIAGLGSGDLLVRAVVQRPGQFPRYYGSALWLGGLSLPLAAAIGWAVARYGLKLEIQPLPLAALMFAEIAGARVSATAENIAVAHRDVVRASAIRLGYAAARFALAVVVLGLLRVSDVSTWIWWMTGQSLLTAIVFLVISTRTYGAPMNTIVRDEFGTGLLFSINQASRAAQGNFDRAFMASVASGEVIGAYAAGSRIVQLGLFPVQILNRLLYPRFFAHGSEGGLAATRRFALRCAPAAIAVGVFGGVAVAVAALAAPTLLGASFHRTTPITMALATAVPLIALQYPAADALTGAGKQALRTVLFVITALVFSLGLAVGAAFGGLWGVVFAFIFGHATVALILWSLVFLLKDAPAPVPDAAP